MRVLSDRDTYRLHAHACAIYGINPHRKWRCTRDIYGATYHLVFQRETPSPDLESSMADLARMINDDIRGPVLKAAAPETYERISKAVEAFHMAYNEQAINLSYDLVEEILNAKLPGPVAPRQRTWDTPIESDRSRLPYDSRRDAEIRSQYWLSRGDDEKTRY